MCHKYYTYLLSLFIITLITSCKKNSPTITTKPVFTDFHIYYKGNTWAYQAITFTTDLPDSIQRSWDYGDGSAVSESLQNIHTYKKDGVYTITLTANGVKVSKIISIGVAAFDKLTKHNNWHRYSYFQLYDTNTHSYGVPIEKENTDVHFSIAYEIDSNIKMSALPYYIVIPGGDRTGHHTFGPLILSVAGYDNVIIDFKTYSADPVFNYCQYTFYNDSVFIKRRESTFGPPYGMYTVHYSSY